MTAWTVEEDSFLRARAGEFCSAGIIADMMPGRTRNSVIGRCARRGISLDGDIVQRRQRRRRVKLARKPCESPPVGPKEAGRGILAPKDKEAVKGVPGRYQCKFPVSGTGNKTIYCRYKKTDKSYCQTHQDLCYGG